MSFPLSFFQRRRTFSKIGLATTALLCAPTVLTQSKTRTQQIVIRDSGGFFSKVYADLLYKPFERATGIKAIGVAAASNPTAQIQAMVRAKNYLWDIASIGDMAIFLLTKGKEVFLEKHELEGDAVISGISPQFISQYSVGTNAYSTVMGYRTDIFKKRQPETWQDLWDVERFPGNRSLRKTAYDTSEIALMANGITPEKLYPCNMDRVFQHLEKIKAHVNFWWTTGPHAEQLLKNDEVDLIPTFISRVQSAMQAGHPISFSWSQHLYGCGSWTILKGTPHFEACRQFIQFASEPKRQAELAKYILSPTHPEAFKHIPLELCRKLPSFPENLKQGLHQNGLHWFEHQEKAMERFNQWMLS